MMQMVRWLDNDRFKFESRKNGQGVGVGRKRNERRRKACEKESTEERLGYPR